MSDMVKRYEESQSPRVVEARNIPGEAVNFIDMQNVYQDEFKLERKKGDPTDFSEKALQYYTEEVKGIVIPEEFNPIEQGVPLNRYTPDNRYYNPGNPK